MQQVTERLAKVISEIREIQRPGMNGQQPADVLLVGCLFRFASYKLASSVPPLIVSFGFNLITLEWLTHHICRWHTVLSSAALSNSGSASQSTLPFI